jgi:hypothetical protein
MNFSYPSEADIEQGTLRLGEMFGCAESVGAVRGQPATTQEFK